MEFLGDVLDWFTTASHWRGETGVPNRLYQHVVMSGSATLAAAVLALPIGVGLGHRRRPGVLGTFAINVANLARAIPSFGILVLFALAFGLRGWPGFGARPAFAALFLLAVPPMVTNSFVGVRDVDADVKEAARGMGMTGIQILLRVELPLAFPLIMAGVRTSAVQVVATATLAAATAWGGLGRFIVDGFAQRDDVQVFAGALLVAVLALVTEFGLGGLQRTIVPRRLEREPDALVSAEQVPELPPAV
jgi:osmoprotectant transport system permease protein